MKIKCFSIISVLLVSICFSTINAQTFVRAKKWVKNKPNQPWENFETRTIKDLVDFKPAKVNRNIYGSNDNEISHNTTGFFRTEKINNRWWMIDPLGKTHFHLAINSFRPGTSDYQKDCFNNTFGTKDKWVELSSNTFRELGFYSTGSWSEDECIRNYNKSNNQKLSYSTNLNFMSSYGKKRGGTYQRAGNIGYPNQCIFVFDPEFQSFCEEHFSKFLDNINDSELIGYFSDNELPFGLKNLEGYLSLENPNDPGRIAAETWIKERNLTKENLTDNDRAEYAGVVAEKYYSIISEVIKKYDSNHLYLGSRLHGGAKFVKQIVQAAGRHCDIVSFNYYGVWTPPSETLRNWEKWAEKPFWITEFYTKAMDSGLANTTGAGFTVETQNDRGYAYQNFCLSLLESPNCVGWDWFRYQDNDPTAKGVDPSNLDSNKGLVNRSYNIYESLAKSMRELNLNIYELIRYFDDKQLKK